MITWPIGPVLHDVVDDPALEFERHDLDQEHRDGQQDQEELMDGAGPQHIAEDIGRKSDRSVPFRSAPCRRGAASAIPCIRILNHRETD